MAKSIRCVVTFLALLLQMLTFTAAALETHVIQELKDRLDKLEKQCGHPELDSSTSHHRHSRSIAKDRGNDFNSDIRDSDSMYNTHKENDYKKFISNASRDKRSSDTNTDIDLKDELSHLGTDFLDNLPSHAQAQKQAHQAVFIAPPDGASGAHRVTKDSVDVSSDLDGNYRAQLGMAIRRMHEQSLQMKEDHHRLQLLNDRVLRHAEALENITAETQLIQTDNRRLRAKVLRLETSLDIYKMSNENLVNHTNGIIKRFRRIEQNVEGVDKDQGTMLQRLDQLSQTSNRLTKNYRRLNKQLSIVENATRYFGNHGYKPARVEGAARKIEITDNDATQYTNNTISELKMADDARITKKYKKLSIQLDDTTQKLYRLSNYVADYTTALELLEAGQDVGMRNDEYLDDNQRILRKKLTDMQTQLQEVYLHYREQLRNGESELPDEVIRTFVLPSTTTSLPFTERDTLVGVGGRSTTTAATPLTPSYRVPQPVTPFGQDSSSRTPQYFVTPPPSSHWSNSHKTRDVSGTGDFNRYTADPHHMISKRTTQPGHGLSLKNTTLQANAQRTTNPSVNVSRLNTTQNILQQWTTQRPTQRTTQRTTQRSSQRPLVIEVVDVGVKSTVAAGSNVGKVTDNNIPTPTTKAGVAAGQSSKSAEREALAGISVPVPTYAQPKCSVTAIRPPKPIAFRGDFISGTWLRDDGMPGSPIYVTTGSDEFRQVLVYQDLWHLINNNYSSVITLPFHCAGSGHVIYLGSIYCNKKNSNRLMRYDFEYKQVTSQKLVRAGYNNTYPYTTGLATDLDFAVDESGLWVTYGSTKHDGLLSVARLNSHTLHVQREWVIKFKKTEALNTFIVCGKVYIVIQNKNNVVAEVQQVYDTYTSTLTELEKPLRLEGDSLYLTMLDYNPMESALHAWGLTRSWLGELVIYDIVVAYE